MNLSTYKETVILGLKQITNYRFEIWLGTFTRLIGLTGLLVLWTIIYQENKGLNVKEIVSYLLIANSVKDAIDAQTLKLSKEFINEIKLGTISSHLLRPINTKLFFYFRFLGNRMTNLIFDGLLFAAGLWISPPKNWLGFGFFLISILIALGLAYCFNTLVGMLAFWSTEASGFRNVANHIIKIFSGSMIPLTFFPDVTKKVILLLPFPILSYLPAVFISGNGATRENIQSLVAAGIWLTVLIPTINYLWLKGIKDYDAIGI